MINKKDLKIELIKIKSEGEELQKVPAVKVTHKPSKKSVTVDYGRSIEENTKRAIELLETIL